MKKPKQKKYKYLVKVTAKDIKLGQECLRKGLINSENCAVTQALFRTFKTRNAAWAYSGGEVKKISIESSKPAFSCKFVENHDALLAVKPFSFYAISNTPIRKGVSTRS